MVPYAYSSQTMVEAMLLEHQQMVQRAMERNRWARVAGPRTPFVARVAGRTLTAVAQAAAAWRRRAGERQGAASEGQTHSAA